MVLGLQQTYHGLKNFFCRFLYRCLRIPFVDHRTSFNSLRPRPNRCHFADDIFICIFENENEWISPMISLTFVPKVRIYNIPALVQIMAWRRPGDKPLSETMMVSLLTHICLTRRQWLKGLIRSRPITCHLIFSPFHLTVILSIFHTSDRYLVAGN